MIDLVNFNFPGAIFIRCESDVPVTATPFVVKGAIMRFFPNEKFISFINGELSGVYAYPRIQVKILRNQLCIFAANEGISPTLSLVEKLKYLIIDRKKINFTNIEMLEYPDQFSVTPDRYHKYKFITPWVALNDQQMFRYEPMFINERREYLNTILSRNLAFMAKDLGIPPAEDIQVRFRASSLTPKVVDYSKLGSFKGYFTSNIRLPDYIGLGNNITKGLGTLVKWEYHPSKAANSRKEDSPDPSPK